MFQPSGKAKRPVKTFLSLCLLLMLAFPASLGSAAAQRSAAQENRIALVVGNGAYAKAPLPTAANDAGLIAQTLQAAGFDVVGARDLDADSLRKSFRDFLQKVEASPADTVALSISSATAKIISFRSIRPSTATPIFPSKDSGSATTHANSRRFP